MAVWDNLLVRQKELIDAIRNIESNFKKDSEHRKTTEYIQKRLNALDGLWGEFESNDIALRDCPDKTGQYFADGIYAETKALCDTVREKMLKYLPSNSNPETESKAKELLCEQKVNFRAFDRFISNIDISKITEKWEMEDELRNLQMRWNNIDSLHLKLDSIYEGTYIEYEDKYSEYEKKFRAMKKLLNSKLSSTSHLFQATPQIEIPAYYGDYAQWPTFLDLYKSGIHDNPILTKAQKMQHLKGKIRGEAQRLIQHLHVSADNYDTAWDILCHRYNNDQVLFTRQIEIFLNQPAIQRQTPQEIKKLHDTTVECIHAIHNLGVDTTSWDPLLVHLLTKKLDPNTLRDYRESRKSPRSLPALDEFTQFLETKFTALEPLCKKEKDAFTPKPNFIKITEKPTYSAAPKPTVRYGFSSNVVCAICNNKHALYQCRKFDSMPPELKLETVTKNGLCKNCLYAHEHNICKSSKRCKVCSGEHNTLLHEAVNDPIKSNSSTPKRQPRHQNANNVTNHDDEILLTTVLIRVRARNHTDITLRALLDQGSQITLITENAAQRLGLPRQHHSASVTGVGINTRSSKGKIALNCQSIHSDFTFTTDALIMPKLINNLPNRTFDKNRYAHLEHIQLADPKYNISGPIDILLDAKVYSEIIMSGLIKSSDNQPVAQQTQLGWILSGRVAATLNCNVVVNNLNDIASFWEMEDITTESSNLTQAEQFCEELYKTTTTRLPCGKYQVRIPMKENFEQLLGHSKARARAQFKQLESKLTKNPKLSESYKQFISEYLDLGHMKKCIIKQDPMCYLPHHGVHREESTTTKLRVVFNASCKTSTGKSLNDLMECGPKLQQDIQDLLMRWRTYQFVYTADCEKMYRCILVAEDQQHLQKILWRDHPQGPLQEYQLCTVTYGMKAAPYLAMRTMKQLATDSVDKYPLAAKVLEQDFYVDDLLSGSNTIEHAREVQKQLILTLKGAGINLRKWSSNTPQLLAELAPEQINGSSLHFANTTATKTLGLRWSHNADIFTFKFIDIKLTPTNWTKRALLSDISRIFDPLGWLSPVSIKAKLLFQQVWLTGTNWDDTVPEDMQRQWQTLRQDLLSIDKLEIPRWIGNFSKPVEIHGFCDASEKAMACVIYLKSIDDKGSTVIRIIAAKTKLAPKKSTLTLPRLELCGGLLLTKLITKILTTLPRCDLPVYGWTDSQVVLGWLQGNPSRWKTFVANRIKDILEVMPYQRWRHISSNDNPADCATRGVSTSQLTSHSLWWTGPSCIKMNTVPEVPKIDIPKIEEKQERKTCTVIASTSIIEILLEKYSSLTRIVRTICYVSRFITNTRHRALKYSARTTNDTVGILRNLPTWTFYLTSNEIENAYNLIIKIIQNKEFANDITHIKTKGVVRSSSTLLKLKPFIDKNGILRVGGRLHRSHLPYDAKHPIVLPKQSRLTELLISQTHLKTLHGGPSLTSTILRQKYWILGGIRTVKKQLRQCIRCFRFSQHKHNQQMSDLPEPRVTPSRPFTHTGVDFTGHVEIKANKGRGIKTCRGYIAVFVCFATKAVHLEIVSDLSTPTFLAAFKRMCARRGTPKHVYSDNGTNFVGASRVLRQEYQEVLQVINDDFLTIINDMGITWHLNAPAWPSAGGLWEAAVKSTKHHLKRVLGDQKLTFEEFSTLLTQIEACLNSRPLYALTEDSQEQCLTPGHFLIGGPLLYPPMTENNPECSRTRWRLTEKMYQDFWKKWSMEYLHHLQMRSKWNSPARNLNVGDIVLIKEDNLPPTAWAMGIVTDVHPGKDGLVRVVTLKARNKEIKRPITKIAPLPIAQNIDKPNSNSPDETNPTCNIRKPRRKPRRYKVNFCTSTLFLLMTFIAPSIQQAFHVEPINSDNTIYFDKVSDIRIIQDQWKIVMYYNMSTYWGSMQAIENHVKLLDSFCDNDTSCASMIAQFEHEVNELKHYNNLLTAPHVNRKRRGLINGIGNLANTLFGVLDDRFAEQYEKDIDTVQRREEHLLTLFKNQTSILETHNNILKRNEAIMNQQYMTIAKNIQVLRGKINDAQSTSLKALQTFTLISSIMTTSVTIANFRRIQDDLVDTVTDIYHGRLNVHLLPPEQIENQLNLISGHLQDDLIVPTDNVRELYGLLRIQAKVTQKFLIMEVTVPLLNRDSFELDKIITIPKTRRNSTVFTISATPYLAMNIKKDTAIPMTESDVQACTHYNNAQIFCPLNHPIYTLKVHESICDMKIAINNNNNRYCQTEIKQCTDKWIRLHARDTWLFSCCKELPIRIVCPDDVTATTLSKTGILKLQKGCTAKGESFIIHTQQDHMSQIYIQQKVYMNTPLMSSSLNQLIKTSLPENIDMEIENHENQFNDIDNKITNMKEETLERFDRNSITHHTISYTILGVLTLITATLLICKFKSCWLQRKMSKDGSKSMPADSGASSCVVEMTTAPTNASTSSETVRKSKRRNHTPSSPFQNREV